MLKDPQNPYYTGTTLGDNVIPLTFDNTIFPLTVGHCFYGCRCCKCCAQHYIPGEYYFTNTTGCSFTDKDIKEFKLKCLPKYKLHGDGSYTKLKDGLADKLA